MDYEAIHKLIWDFKYQYSTANSDNLISYAILIGSIGALLYISVRVWGHIARAEPIDVFPLLRPFAIGLVIFFFPAFLGLLDGAFQPLSKGTDKMAGNVGVELKSAYNEQKSLIQERNESRIQAVTTDTEEDDQNGGNKLLNDLNPTKFFKLLRVKAEAWMASAESDFRQWVMDGLRWLYQAAALFIEVMAVFALLILSIFGPLSFGLSIFDGLSNSMVSWCARYINVSLWVPIANVLRALLGKMELFLVNQEVSHLSGAEAMSFTENVSLIIFYIMGALCFFLVPTIAGWIISGGGNTNAIGNKFGSFVSGTAGALGTATGLAVGGAVYGASKLMQNKDTGDVKEG